MEFESGNLMTIIGGFVLLVVAFALYPTVNTFVNTLYTTSAINSSTGFAHQTQPIVPIISLNLTLIGLILVKCGPYR
jgi:hypothetical protein